ncbi:MAG: phosphoglycerate mutase family protein [Bacteroidales bacterium]|nr:phosphoglycerate mutase family protein [Bacteroidales bacterium]
MDNIIKLSNNNQKKAWKIINYLDIINVWSSIGAKANLIGSLKMGLLMNHLDIDFHIYSDTINVEDSFKAMALLAKNPRIKKIEYVNNILTEEECIEWHAFYEDEEKRIWIIDMIHILKGSLYDGFFEKMAEKISACLNPEIKETIIRLKYETPDNIKIMGIEYYQAVIKDGIKNYKEFEDWRKLNPVNGIVTWMP